jgi:hypothetical protein
MAMAEPRDFVHIYYLSPGKFDNNQEIDLFGELAGISFSPDPESLFVGIFDRNCGSLLDFERMISLRFLLLSVSERMQHFGTQ